jgi:hypothetical protein
VVVFFEAASAVWLDRPIKKRGTTKDAKDTKTTDAKKRIRIQDGDVLDAVKWQDPMSVSWLPLI